MILTGRSKECELAVEYYYHCQSSELGHAVPKAIAEHVSSCRYCQGEVDKLHDHLNAPEDPRELERMEALTKNLQLHFSWADTPVNCQIAKPFLPAQAVKHLTITVSSPITHHLEQCRECQQDLNTIKELNLRDCQYYRLAQLLTEQQSDDYQFPDIVGTLAALSRWSISELSPLQRKQICRQKHYRDQLYQERQRSWEMLSNVAQDKAASDREISAAQLFDFVVPYGAEADETHRQMAEKLRSTPQARERVQRLHRALYRIVDRADSGVVTVFESDSKIPGESVTAEGVEDESSVNAKGATAEQETQPIPESPSAALSRLVKRNRKYWITPWAVAAAVIIAVGVIWHLDQATAVDPGPITSALAQEKNIHIENYLPGESAPVQEIWASRSRHINLIKTPRLWTLWDLENRTRTVSPNDSDNVDSRQLESNVYDRAKKQFDNIMGVIPQLTRDPSETKATWSISDKESETRERDLIVYERESTSRTSAGDLISHRWRGFIDSKTHLPVRTESYRKMGKQEEYQLASYSLIDYVTDADIQAAVQAVTNADPRLP